MTILPTSVGVVPLRRIPTLGTVARLLGSRASHRDPSPPHVLILEVHSRDERGQEVVRRRIAIRDEAGWRLAG